MKTIKAIALQYGNPQLFPSMLPWLFPYGLGGIGQTEHKHKLSNFDGDDFDGDGDFPVHEEYEADPYTSVGKKGQQRLEQMAEIQKIVTSAGWLDQCPDGPPSMDFTEVDPEELPPSQWDAAVQEKRQQVLAERNKALPTQPGKKNGRPKSK